MLYIARFPLFILLSVLSWAIPAYAQSPSPYNASVLSNSGNHIKLQVFGLGLTEIRLTPKRTVSFHGKTVETYRGKATTIQRGKRTSRKRTEAISAVGYRDSRGEKHLEVSFLNSKRMYRVHLDDGKSARVARGPLISHFNCDHPSHSHASSEQFKRAFAGAGPRSTTPVEFREVEIAIDLDYEAKELLGERLVTSVVALVENANLFFERDLGVHLKLRNINPDIRPANYPVEADTIQKLIRIFDQTRNYLGEADVYYLLVGRETKGTVVGMASPDYWCDAGILPELSHATSGFKGFGQDSWAFAHEIGHLLWAGHTTEPGLMSTTDQQPFFENIVRDQVRYFLSLSESDCLSRVSLVPQPTPTATPTVTPTWTPDPTPAPDPTPLPRILPPVTRLKLAQDGILSGGVELKSPRAGCSLSIHAGLDTYSARTSRPIISLSPVSSVYTLSGKVTQRLKPNSSRDTRRVYVVAGYSCPGLLPQFSRSVALKPSSLRKGRYTTHANWLKHLKRVLKITQN